MLFLLQPQEKVFSLVRGRVFSRAPLAEGPMIDGFGMENLPEKDMYAVLVRQRKKISVLFVLGLLVEPACQRDI
jgi:hypothetical protein